MATRQLTPFHVQYPYGMSTKLMTGRVHYFDALLQTTALYSQHFKEAFAWYNLNKEKFS